jgi:TRAP-type mannitol/chloroaromatic compound transport system substrate-binding protein
MRPTDLTEPTKKVVMDILLNKLDQKAYDTLNEDEKDIIRKFCDLAKITVCEAYNKEIEALQLKAEVLIGEIKSGNDSKVVKKMLIQAIETLLKHNGISKIEGLELLNQLKE